MTHKAKIRTAMPPGTITALWKAINDQMETTKRPKSDATFQTGSELWAKVYEFFQWCESNPLEENKLVTFEGDANIAAVPKMRVPTVHALASYIGITRRTWYKWADPKDDLYRPELAPIISTVNDIIYDTKYTAGAAGLVSAAMMIRDLNLADATHIQQTTAEVKMGTIDESRIANIMHPNATPEMLDAYYAAGKEPPMYTQQQLDAGMDFIPYRDE